MLFFFFYDNSKQAAATVEIIITKGLNSELIKRPRVSINMCFHALLQDNSRERDNNFSRHFDISTWKIEGKRATKNAIIGPLNFKEKF